MGETKNQINTGHDSTANPTIGGNTATSLKDTLGMDTGNLTAKQAIDLIEGKLFPIKSGEVKLFNPNKKLGFITPNDDGVDIHARNIERELESGEEVNYIEVNREAILTEPGQVKFVKYRKETEDNKRKIAMVFVIPEDHNKKDVVAKNTDSDINLDDFNEGDEVEFVANKKGTIVAIQKKI